MAINSVNNDLSATNQTYSASKAQENEQTASKQVKEDTKVKTDTVEINSSSKSAKKTSASKTSTVDTDAVQKAIRESEAKMSQFKSLIEKLFKQQGKTSVEADWDILAKSGKLGDALKNLEVDEATQKQAQEDISEDGYWGVKKTSERILDFAKALAGNDSSKADALLEAYKKGFEAAEDAFGGKDKLPDICYKTYDAVLKGFEDWKNEGSTSSTSDMQDTTFEQTAAQAAKGAIS